MSEAKRTVGILVSDRDGIGADQVILIAGDGFDEEDGGPVRVFVPNRTFCEILEFGGSDRTLLIRFKSGQEFVANEGDLLKSYTASERVIDRQVIDPIIDEEPTKATRDAYPEIDRFTVERIHAA